MESADRFGDQASTTRFQCPWPGCGTSYVREKKLPEHMRIHTGEKPFLCVICNKAFHKSDNYQRHLQTHADRRSFPCDFAECNGSHGCGKTFRRKQDLKRHLETKRATWGQMNKKKLAILSKDTRPPPQAAAQETFILPPARTLSDLNCSTTAFAATKMCDTEFISPARVSYGPQPFISPSLPVSNDYEHIKSIVRHTSQHGANFLQNLHRTLPHLALISFDNSLNTQIRWCIHRAFQFQIHPQEIPVVISDTPREMVILELFDRISRKDAHIPVSVALHSAIIIEMLNYRRPYYDQSYVNGIRQAKESIMAAPDFALQVVRKVANAAYSPSSCRTMGVSDFQEFVPSLPRCHFKRSPHILVISTSEHKIETLKLRLEMDECIVTVARDKVELNLLLDCSTHDLIVFDLDIPSATEFYHWIQARLPRVLLDKIIYTFLKKPEGLKTQFIRKVQKGREKSSTTVLEMTQCVVWPQIVPFAGTTIIITRSSSLIMAIDNKLDHLARFPSKKCFVDLSSDDIRRLLWPSPMRRRCHFDFVQSKLYNRERQYFEQCYEVIGDAEWTLLQKAQIVRRLLQSRSRTDFSHGLASVKRTSFISPVSGSAKT